MFWLCHTFLALQAQLVFFIICCSSTHGCPRVQPLIVKVGEGARAAPPMPHGVGTTGNIIYGTRQNITGFGNEWNMEDK